MADHVWSYQAESLIGTTSEVGPITEPQLLEAARAGKLKPETLVTSPTRTKGGWVKVQQIAGLMQAIASGSQEREAAKEQAAKEKAANQQTAAAERQTAADQQSMQRAELVRQLAQISHCSNVDLVKTIVERVQGILTSQETVQYIAVQQKPLINIAPDALVATNRRLIFLTPTSKAT